MQLIRQGLDQPQPCGEGGRNAAYQLAQSGIGIHHAQDGIPVAAMVGRAGQPQPIRAPGGAGGLLPQPHPLPKQCLMPLIHRRILLQVSLGGVVGFRPVYSAAHLVGHGVPSNHANVCSYYTQGVCLCPHLQSASPRLSSWCLPSSCSASSSAPSRHTAIRACCPWHRSWPPGTRWRARPTVGQRMRPPCAPPTGPLLRQPRRGARRMAACAAGSMATCSMPCCWSCCARTAPPSPSWPCAPGRRVPLRRLAAPAIRAFATAIISTSWPCGAGCAHIWSRRPIRMPRRGSNPPHRSRPAAQRAPSHAAGARCILRG